MVCSRKEQQTFLEGMGSSVRDTKWTLEQVTHPRKLE
jgi:hypothetical protein